MSASSLSDFEKSYPMCFKTSEYLKNQASFFKFTIPKLLDQDFDFDLAERVCRTGFEVSSQDWEQYTSHLNELCTLSREFLELQVQLEKTGNYKFSTFKEVQENIYEKNTEQGPSYLWGLYFSEIFWKTHHEICRFFSEEFVKDAKQKRDGNVLEIPLGNGFFLSEFLRENKSWNGTGIDISKHAVELAERILSANKILSRSYKLVNDDFFEFSEEKKFDRIICGEFLEHVEDPLKVLKKLNSLLLPEGKIALTTAIWAANIDHIYLYKSAEEVRDHIRAANFEIEKELVQSVFEKNTDPEQERIPVSYTAVIRKSN